MKTQCQARVPISRATYMERNTERRCENSARDNGFCHAHQRYAKQAELRDPEWAAAFEDLKASIT